MGVPILDWRVENGRISPGEGDVEALGVGEGVLVGRDGALVGARRIGDAAGVVGRPVVLIERWWWR